MLSRQSAPDLAGEERSRVGNPESLSDGDTAQ